MNDPTNLTNSFKSDLNEINQQHDEQHDKIDLQDNDFSLNNESSMDNQNKMIDELGQENTIADQFKPLPIPELSLFTCNLSSENEQINEELLQDKLILNNQVDCSS